MPKNKKKKKQQQQGQRPPNPHRVWPSVNLKLKRTMIASARAAAMAVENMMKNRNTDTPGNSSGCAPNTEDFSKDLLDIGDASYGGMNAISLTTDTSNKMTPTNFTGKKIPVNMREDIVRKRPNTVLSPPVVNKQWNAQANQLLKDCLSSDIKAVVQDSIRPKVQPTNTYVTYPQPFLHTGAPRGIPKSFLNKAEHTFGSLRPDAFKQINTPLTGQEPNTQTAQVMAEQHMFGPISQPQSGDGQKPPTFNQTSASPTRYSPTDLYNDLGDDNKDGDLDKEGREGSESPDDWLSGEKRVSAFERLGPVAQQKKPKLTINLSFNKEQAVREVVDESAEPLPSVKEYVPVPEREDMTLSTDDTVMRYLALWPWTKGLDIRRTAAASRQDKSGENVTYSPTAMMMLREKMDLIYQKENTFVGISVTGYPASWTKEDVLDAMLDSLKGKPFIPCFIDFNANQCNFLVLRSRLALLALHTLDFSVQKDGVRLSVRIQQLRLSIRMLDFIPRLVLRKRLAMACTDETKMDLSAFTLQPDISHFIYYPLNHLTNQIELLGVPVDTIWSNITVLNLSHNRLTTLVGFELEQRFNRLRELDLSHNRLDRITVLFGCRKLPLVALRLEGNPLCCDYIDPARYVAVARALFPHLRTLDGIPIHLKGDLPAMHRYYCPHGSVEIIDNFMQIYFPLLDSPDDDRVKLQYMYDEDAMVTITYRPKFGFESEFRYPRNLLLLSRVVLEGGREYAGGRRAVERLLRRWPAFEHDPAACVVDVLLHTDTSIIFRIDGIVKLPADSLAENDQLVAFSRTIHLRTTDGVEYKIRNEMVYWNEPTEECKKAAFQRTLVQKNPLTFKLELPADAEDKKKLVKAFMKITKLEEKQSERCLDLKTWDIKEALEHFTKLYKTDNLQMLN